MTLYYVGSGGNNGNAGTSWSARRLTLTSIETLVAAGDTVYVGPGVYRETLTCGVSGGSNYSTGTVTVTNGSTTVTGSGTTWSGNAFANGQFTVTQMASGTDGVGHGTTTFDSAAGNFQSGMVGMVIQIAGQGAYTINTVNSATQVILSGSPANVGSLTYTIMRPGGHIEIASVDSNTQITLKKPWPYPTFSGLAYITYKDIKYIADVTGENTDGVGGQVRITGSDNDQTATRTSAIITGARSYRTFRGFSLDSTTGTLWTEAGAADIIIEDAFFQNATSGSDIILCANASQLRWTIRRCMFVAASTVACVRFFSGSTFSNLNHIIENCIAISRGYAVWGQSAGGFRVSNCIISGLVSGIRGSGLASGQAVVVNNCILVSCGTSALFTDAALAFVEDYNTFYANTTDRTTVSVGAHSQTYPPLFNSSLLTPGIVPVDPYYLWRLSSASQVAAIAGLFPPYDDFFGIPRPTTNAKCSWGAIQADFVIRNTATVHGGSASMKFPDAGRKQFIVPTANVSTTISCYVYRESDYTGTNPQMIIHQSGQADIVVTDAAAAGQWNQLTTTFTPAALPSFVIVELVSNNTAAGWLIDDEFTTAHTAPLIGTRNCEPGPGALVTVQTGGNFSISSDSLVFPAQGAPAWGNERFYGGPLARVAGLGLIGKLHLSTAANTIVGFSQAVGDAYSLGGLYLSAGQLSVLTEGGGQTGVAGTISSGNDYQFAVIDRTAGFFLFIKGGVFSNWTLVFIFSSYAGQSIPMFSNYNGVGTLDYFRVRNTGITDSIATVNVTASSGVTQTADADGIYNLAITLPAGSANLVAAELRYRRQDATNYWSFYIKRNAGNTAWDAYLDKVTAGTPVTQTGFPVTGVGIVSQIQVNVQGTKHNCYTTVTTDWTKRGGEISDSAFQTQTTIDPIAGAGTTLGNLLCCPITSLSLYSTPLDATVNIATYFDDLVVS